MATTSPIVHSLCSSVPLYSPKLYKNQTLTFTSNSYSRSHFLPPNENSFLKLKKQSPFPTSLNVRSPRIENSRSSHVVFAVQSNFFKIIQTAWKVGKDGIEAGTKLVPDLVPRPIARISVTIAVLAVSLFVLKSVLSTALFTLAMMGLIYFVFIALNKDQGSRGGDTNSSRGGGDANSSEDPLEEARRIMEKYK